MAATFRTMIRTGLLLIVMPCTAHAAAWDRWGGDDGGTRYSAETQITAANVTSLIKAWDYRSGDIARRPAALMARTKSEATPLFVEDSIVFCTPFNEVIALDPGTGAQKWRFDPKISTNQRPANRYTCRGLAYWRDPQAVEHAVCGSRLFMGTNDARVIALDARTGTPCGDFGTHGEVRLDPGISLAWPGEFQITSPPVISHGVIVVGSSIADNFRIDAPKGTVRAFDARSGRPMWNWDPLRHDGIEAAQANVWAPMSVDDKLGLVFLPTSSPSPDFWGGKRPGNNADADSVVALRIETGERVWSFQTVHHDLWDYDLPAQPTLARIDTGAGQRDVVIQATKQGFIFVLDRATGAPIWPIEERPVPQGGVEGEQLSPTQPFPTHVPALIPQKIDASQAFGLVPFWDRAACRTQLERARNDGLYTPPSLQGTVLFPMTGGGVNWGGVAFDPDRQILYANTSAAVHIVTLIAAERAKGFHPPPGYEFAPQRGGPFAMTRGLARSQFGALCNPPPWGSMVAVDLKAGKILWRSTVGTTEDVAPLGIALHWGTPLLSGVLVTAGRLVFTGAMDAYLRAFDAASGTELWQGRLPVPGTANPMTYVWKGEQYIAIVAGGHSEGGTSIGDSIVAFRLPHADEGPSLRSRTIDRPGGRFAASAAAAAVALIALFMIAVGWRRRHRRVS